MTLYKFNHMPLRLKKKEKKKANNQRGKKNHRRRNARKKKKSKTPYSIDQTKNTREREKKQSTHEKGRWFYHLTTTTFLPSLPYFLPRLGREHFGGLEDKLLRFAFSLLTNQTPTKTIFSPLFSLSFSIISKISLTTKTLNAFKMMVNWKSR